MKDRELLCIMTALLLTRFQERRPTYDEIIDAVSRARDILRRVDYDIMAAAAAIDKTESAGSGSSD